MAVKTRRMVGKLLAAIGVILIVAAALPGYSRNEGRGKGVTTVRFGLPFALLKPSGDACYREGEAPAEPPLMARREPRPPEEGHTDGGFNRASAVLSSFRVHRNP